VSKQNLALESLMTEAMVTATTPTANLGRYIAAEPGNQRRDPGTTIKSSDAILDTTKRRRVIEGARELWRNYSAASWAIRKHLDFVSTFSFQAGTQDTAFNERLEGLMTWWQRPLNCDVAQRHSFRKMLRLSEARRVLDGDVFLVKYNDGRLQGIEGDRVRDPSDTSKGNWIHGINYGPRGQVLQVQIHRRLLHGTYEEERAVSAGNIIQLGYFDSFDQYRGVSPLAAAIPEFQDCLEVKDYARAKAKITQLFALAITREMADTDEDEERDGYQIDLGRGPVKVELDPGDKMDFLESKHPSTEFQAFLTMCLQAALKALDLPWSFYDEAYTNFFGSRSALLLYLKSVEDKRADLKEMLDRITVWKIGQWVAQGLLNLPAGTRIDDLNWDWIPSGMPWWDPSKEIDGDLKAIQGKLRTRSEIRRERYGDDWKDVVRKLREEEDFLIEQGFDPADLPGVTHGNSVPPQPGDAPSNPQDPTQAEDPNNGL
jgi:capsid protein